MERRSIYFIFTDTGTLLSKAINYSTGHKLNHVSIALDEDLKEVYSFGRKIPNNPFIGGFVRENIEDGLLSKSKTEIYKAFVTKESYDTIVNNIRNIEKMEDMLKYNFIGLFYVLFDVKKERDRNFFCSEFVSYVIKDCKEFELPKDTFLMKPQDIRNLENLVLVYKGNLSDYKYECIVG